MKKRLDETNRMLQLNGLLNEDAKVEDEFDSEEELDETTPNQRKHRRKVDGGSEQGLGGSVRTNTVYGHTSAVAGQDKVAHDPKYDYSTSGKRKGKLKKSVQNQAKADIKMDKQQRDDGSNSEWSVKKSGKTNIIKKGKLPEADVDEGFGDGIQKGYYKLQQKRLNHKADKQIKTANSRKYGGESTRGAFQDAKGSRNKAKEYGQKSDAVDARRKRQSKMSNEDRQRVKDIVMDILMELDGIGQSNLKTHDRVQAQKKHDRDNDREHKAKMKNDKFGNRQHSKMKKQDSLVRPDNYDKDKEANKQYGKAPEHLKKKGKFKYDEGESVESYAKSQEQAKKNVKKWKKANPEIANKNSFGTPPNHKSKNEATVGSPTINPTHMRSKQRQSDANAKKKQVKQKKQQALRDKEYRNQGYE